ncbi:MAG: DUF3500 domain-containing protein [Limisphaerales bacterium]
MKTRSFLRQAVWFAAGCALSISLHAHPAADAMTAAAKEFLGALKPEQKARAHYADLKDNARQAWHFIPTEMVTFGRKGLPMTEMTEPQRKLALALLHSGMSDHGYQKATSIMSLEGVLRELEKNGRVERNPIKYFVSIYGTPDARGTWAWRFEGHHLSLSFTIVDGKEFAAVPSFMGTNPAEVREGPKKGLRVLGVEEDLARELVKSLSAEQRAEGICDKVAPKDIITSADRSAKRLSPEGIVFSKLNAPQKDLIRRIVSEYASRVRSDVAKTDLAKIDKAGWEKVAFAWAGRLERGDGHYYRVQGPTFLLEYDNTQNNANHVHAVWRDFTNDFGGDLLKRHYEQAHKQ